MVASLWERELDLISNCIQQDHLYLCAPSGRWFGLKWSDVAEVRKSWSQGLVTCVD
jgi:hypothetical protein